MGESVTWLKTFQTPQDICAGKISYLLTFVEPPGSRNAFSLKEHLNNFLVFKYVDVKTYQEWPLCSIYEA